MAINTKVRAQRGEQFTEIKILINHPMQNGRNRDPMTGQLIPAHFIQELTVEKNGKTVIRAQLGVSMSQNPFFTFRMKDASRGDRLRVYWVDNLGLSDSAEHVID